MDWTAAVKRPDFSRSWGIVDPKHKKGRKGKALYVMVISTLSVTPETVRPICFLSRWCWLPKRTGQSNKLEALAAAVKNVVTAVGNKQVDLTAIQGYEGLNPVSYTHLGRDAIP